MATRAQRTITFAVWGPIAPDDVPGLSDRVCALFRAEHPEIAFCDVRGVEPSAACVDALARLQLGARRAGCQVRLRNASPALVGLVELLGLSDVLPE